MSVPGWELSQDAGPGGGGQNAGERDGQVHEQRIEPRSLGLAEATPDQLTAADLDEATSMVRGVIDGTLTGPPRDMTLLNSAATLVVADKVPSIEKGLNLAGEAIDSGAAKTTLGRLIELSNEVSPGRAGAEG